VNKWKRIFCVFLGVFALLEPISTSKAAPSGCPSEWNIPKNLFDASVEQRKEVLTPDFYTVIKPNRDAEYSFDGLTWVKVKNGYMNLPGLDSMVWQDPLFEKNSQVTFLTGFFSNRYDDLTLISFGDMKWINQSRIYVRTSMEILKQNCVSSATYYYQQQFLPLGLETTNFESEAQKIKNSFQNYQVFDSFSQQYKNCISKWENYDNSTQIKKPLEPCYLEVPSQYIRKEIKLVPDEPNCLVFLPGNSNTASGIGIKPGTKCSYTILGFTGDAPYVSSGQGGMQATGGRISSHYNVRTGNLVSFGKLTINSLYKTSTITCVKGKVTKKVTAVSPKCPAGYKKK
jgi:hypothetical protein